MTNNQSPAISTAYQTPSERERQQRELIKSLIFILGPDTRWAKLLEILYEAYVRGGHKSRQEILDRLHSKTSEAMNNTISELRGKLRDLKREDFKELKTNAWEVRVPRAGASEGWTLIFKRIDGKLSPTEAFWKVHDESLSMFIVCNIPLFFQSIDSRAAVPENSLFFRFTDVNQTGSLERANAISRLKDRHPHISYLLEMINQPYTPCQSFIYTGEIDAFDLIYEWALTTYDYRLARHNSYNISDREMAQSSPILFGNPRVNRWIERIMESPRCAYLGYKVSTSRYGVIEIRYLQGLEREKERMALEENAKDNIRFPDTNDNRIEAELHDDPDGLVFMLLTRIPNIFGSEGVITIISTEHSRTYPSLVKFLTSDDDLYALFEKIHWMNKPIPLSFQAVFSVRVSDVSTQAGIPEAKLVSFRSYELSST